MKVHTMHQYPENLDNADANLEKYSNLELLRGSKSQKSKAGITTGDLKFDAASVTTAINVQEERKNKESDKNLPFQPFRMLGGIYGP